MSLGKRWLIRHAESAANAGAATSNPAGCHTVHAVMRASKLDGVHASPKGLRHGFEVVAVCAGIPLDMVQKWLGHTQLSTTAIYANAVGAEEKAIPRRMWGERSLCTCAPHAT